MVLKRCLNTIMICCLLGTSPALAGDVAECGSEGLQLDPEQVVSRLVSFDPLSEEPTCSERLSARDLGQDPEPLAAGAEDAMVAFSPAPAIGVFAGYRFLEKDVAKNSVRLDTEFDGPYVGALIRF